MLEYNVNWNLLFRVSGASRELVAADPGITELAELLLRDTLLRIRIDSAMGGAIPCAEGILRWLRLHGCVADIQLVLDNSHALPELPISARRRERFLCLQRQYPEVRLVPTAVQTDRLCQVNSYALKAIADVSGTCKISGSKYMGCRILGVGSSVGKGTIALSIGYILRQKKKWPIPFKALAALEWYDPEPFELQRCPSTVIQWHSWHAQMPMPAYLNPVLIAPDKPSGGVHGRCSVFSEGVPTERLQYTYTLSSFYSQQHHRYLVDSLSQALQKALDYRAAYDGVLITEGGGSLVEIPPEWDFANWTPLNVLNLPIALVTSADQRGFFTLWGTLIELSNLGQLRDIIGVVASETRLRSGSHLIAREIKKLTEEQFGVHFCGWLPYEQNLAAVSEDISPHPLARIQNLKLGSENACRSLSNLVERILTN